MLFFGIIKSAGKIRGLTTIEQDLFPESIDDLIQCLVSCPFLYEGHRFDVSTKFFWFDIATNIDQKIQLV